MYNCRQHTTLFAHTKKIDNLLYQEALGKSPSSHHHYVKEERRKLDHANYRGVTLFFIAGKILAKILLDKLALGIAEEVPGSQCGQCVFIQQGVINIAILKRIQSCWARHVSRNEDYRFPKVMLCDALATGFRNKSAPDRRYIKHPKTISWLWPH
ncbi:hypothetical protein LOAG_12702 [Loa loa]|uniref:Uncharacterized protein n=1 Tax=Loa loa TaxID=7209 RepID=A0A1S0TKT3_LOALO|nr:hypothetical protein LOAG_12702 [Loa loa]EFO15806.1 hypothetical protein LOAG_12702 [Loa loa]